MNPPAGDVTLDPGRGMAWVDEHGAHLVDYASCHLESSAMLTAVTAALTTCAARERPGNVTDRAWLLSVLRRECAIGPGRGFVPGPGPGGPDDRAVRRAWRLADPLGAETLRLLYRHELALRDLAQVLALPVKEAGRLVARTQDVIEILVSGLDGLARGRPICPETAPLVAAVFPDERSESPDFGPARTALLTHIVTCVVCKRPINIRYTVPQILSRPPVADLTPDVRQRLLDAVEEAARPALPAPYTPPAPYTRPSPYAPPAPYTPPTLSTPPASTVPYTPPALSTPSAGPVVAPIPPKSPAGPSVPADASAPSAAAAHRPPSSFGMPLGAPVDTASPPAAPSPTGSAPPGTSASSGTSVEHPESHASAPPVPVPPVSVPPLVPPDSGLTAAGPGGDARSPRSEDTRPGRLRPPHQVRREPGPPGTARPADPGGPADLDGVDPGRAKDRPVRAFSQEDTQPSLPWPSRRPGTTAAGRDVPPGQDGPPEGARPLGQDTPLYNALLSQIRQREALARAAGAAPGAQTQDAAGTTGVTSSEAEPYAEPDSAGRPLPGVQIRVVEVLARVGSLVRATALRIVIVVVAGAAGTVTGINLFAPAPAPERVTTDAGVLQATAGPGETSAADAPGTATSADPGSRGATAGSAVPPTATASVPAVPPTATASVPAVPQADGQGDAPRASASPAVFLMGAWGVQAPPVITLDAFGRGTFTISTTSGKPVKWRISAPGLIVEPSSGTLKPGHADVLTVRALRVRYWCGTPAPVTAPLAVHGPKGRKGTATVRWSTC